MLHWRQSTLLAAVTWVVHATTCHGQTIKAKPVDSKIPWVYSYEEGKKVGQRTGKPLFVVFRCER